MLLEYFEQLLEIVYPKAIRADPVCGAVVSGYTDCWANFKTVMELLTTDFNSNDTRAERTAAKIVRANLVEQAGQKFVRAMNEHTGNSGSVYQHVLVAHLPKQILLLGDLRPYSGQGIEHTHALEKAALLQASNRQQQHRLNSVTNVMAVMQDKYVGMSAQQKDSLQTKRDQEKYNRLMNAPQKAETIGDKKRLFEEFVPHEDYLTQIKQLFKLRAPCSAPVVPLSLAQRAQQTASRLLLEQPKKKKNSVQRKKK